MKLYHYLRALLSGYFWLPCPRCGQMFGGHQVSERNGRVIYDDYHKPDKITCPKCPGIYRASKGTLGTVYIKQIM